MNTPHNKYLFLIGFSLFIELLVLAIIKPYVSDFETISFISVGLHVFFVTLLLSGTVKSFKSLFILAFLIRVTFMFWDVYAKDIFLFPNSGVDSEMYYLTAVDIGNNLLLLSTNLQYGIYSKILGIVFYFTGPQRLLAQYFNVLFGLSVVFLLYKILQLLEIRRDISKSILFIAAFFPTSLIMSAILLREIVPTFFATYSFYFFIKWFKIGLTSNFILSLVMLGVASMFHAGVIGIFFGYAFVFLFYNKEFNVYRFSSRTLLFSIVLAGLSYVAIVYYSDVLFIKLSNIDEISAIYKSTNRRAGGAVYLTDMTINNPWQLLIYGPVRAFYFLTSPLPMDWRGGADILTFLLDSMLYFWVIFYFLKNRKWFNQQKKLITAIALMLIGVSLIFGFGVSNAGTAMRHRQKILPIFLVLAAVMLDEKKKATINVNQGLNC